MLIPIPTGMRYTATVSGSVWKPLTCEFCKLDFAYRITRKATGTGRSALFLDNDGARARAGSYAYANLQRELEKSFEVVPCPKCGRYQAQMFSKLKWKKKGGLTIAGIIGVVLTATVAPAVPSPLLVFAIGAALSVAALVIGELRRSRFDPNADCETRTGDRGENVVKRSDYEAAMDAAAA